MNFRNLEYFLQVARTQNITVAASQLYITQQALSSCIAKLEKELGIRLFDGGRPLKLTAQGQIVAERAQNILKQYEELLSELHRGDSATPDVLRLGGVLSREIVVTNMVSRIAKQYPQAMLRVTSAQNDQLISDVLHDRLDIALGIMQRPTAGIEVIDVMPDRLFLIIPEQVLARCLPEPIDATLDQIKRNANFSELSNCPFLMLNCDYDPEAALHNILFHDTFFRTNVVFETKNIQTLLTMCVQGRGIAFCPEIYLPLLHQLTGENGNPVIHSVPLCIDSHFTWIRRQGKPKSKLEEACIQLIRDANLRE